jgi:hypothetical protein
MLLAPLAAGNSPVHAPSSDRESAAPASIALLRIRIAWIWSKDRTGAVLQSEHHAPPPI